MEIGQALHLSARDGELEVLKLLFESDSPPNVDSQEYGITMKTALHEASEHGRTEAIQFLLSIGAKVDLNDKTNSSALYYASLNGHTQIVELLLKAGSDANSQRNDFKTSLHAAAYNGHLEAVKALLKAEGIRTEQQDENKETALHKAATKGHNEICGAILDVNETSVNVKDKTGKTSLSAAFLAGNDDLVTLLLGHNADVNSQDEDLKSVLHLAADRGDGNMVKTLIEKGADVNAVDKLKQTALHLAADRGHADVVSLLLEAKINVDAQEFMGMTALHKAAGKCHASVISLLIGARATVNMVDELGETALYRVLYQSHVQIVKLNSERLDNKVIKNSDVSQGGSPKSNRQQVVQMLLDAMADPNIQNNDKLTLLHWACNEGEVEVARALLAAGASPDIQDQDGQTALFSAVAEGNDEIVALLLEANADVTVVDHDQQNVLHIAAVSGYSSLVSVLLAAGASSSGTDKEGRTAAEYAEQRGHSEVLEVLKTAEKEHEMQATQVQQSESLATLSAQLSAQKDYFASQITALQALTEEKTADYQELLGEKSSLKVNNSSFVDENQVLLDENLASLAEITEKFNAVQSVYLNNNSAGDNDAIAAEKLAEDAMVLDQFKSHIQQAADRINSKIVSNNTITAEELNTKQTASMHNNDEITSAVVAHKNKILASAKEREPAALAHANHHASEFSEEFSAQYDALLAIFDHLKAEFIAQIVNVTNNFITQQEETKNNHNAQLVEAYKQATIDRNALLETQKVKYVELVAEIHRLEGVQSYLRTKQSAAVVPSLQAVIAAAVEPAAAPVEELDALGQDTPQLEQVEVEEETTAAPDSADAGAAAPVEELVEEDSTDAIEDAAVVTTDDAAVSELLAEQPTQPSEVTETTEATEPAVAVVETVAEVAEVVVEAGIVESSSELVTPSAEETATTPVEAVVEEQTAEPDEKQTAAVAVEEEEESSSALEQSVFDVSFEGAAADPDDEILMASDDAANITLEDNAVTDGDAVTVTEMEATLTTDENQPTAAGAESEPVVVPVDWPQTVEQVDSEIALKQLLASEQGSEQVREGQSSRSNFTLDSTVSAASLCYSEDTAAAFDSNLDDTDNTETSVFAGADIGDEFGDDNDVSLGDVNVGISYGEESSLEVTTENNIETEGTAEATSELTSATTSETPTEAIKSLAPVGKQKSVKETAQEINDKIAADKRAEAERLAALALKEQQERERLEAEALVEQARLEAIWAAEKVEKDRIEAEKRAILKREQAEMAHAQAIAAREARKMNKKQSDTHDKRVKTINRKIKMLLVLHPNNPKEQYLNEEEKTDFEEVQHKLSVLQTRFAEWKGQTDSVDAESMYEDILVHLGTLEKNHTLAADHAKPSTSTPVIPMASMSVDSAPTTPSTRGMIRPENSINSVSGVGSTDSADVAPAVGASASHSASDIIVDVSSSSADELEGINIVLDSDLPGGVENTATDISVVTAETAQSAADHSKNNQETVVNNSTSNNNITASATTAPATAITKPTPTVEINNSAKVPAPAASSPKAHVNLDSFKPAGGPVILDMSVPPGGGAAGGPQRGGAQTEKVTNGCACVIC